MCCPSGKLQNHKWENAMTVDKLSWGYRRNADIMDYLTIEELLYQLVSTVRLGNKYQYGQYKYSNIPLSQLTRFSLFVVYFFLNLALLSYL